LLCLTVWPLSEWRKQLELVRVIRPHAVMLHSDCASLEQHAATIAGEVRRALAPNPPEVWLGVAGDSGIGKARKGTITAEALHEYRMRSVRAAKAAQAARYMIDPETAWKSRLPGFDEVAARRWIEAAKTELQGAPEARSARKWVGDRFCPVLVTSFDCPGYHSALPWRGFDDCDCWAPQIYAAPAKGAEPGASEPRGRGRLALHRKFWRRAISSGVLRDRPVIAYVQGHHVVPRETCAIANEHDEVCMWALGPRWDANGTLAARALVALEQRGFHGPGRIKRFQESTGLAADGLIGPRTLRALGLDA
jgi:hypothetical protein